MPIVRIFSNFKKGLIRLFSNVAFAHLCFLSLVLNLWVGTNWFLRKHLEIHEFFLLVVYNLWLPLATNVCCSQGCSASLFSLHQTVPYHTHTHIIFLLQMPVTPLCSPDSDLSECRELLMDCCWALCRQILTEHLLCVIGTLVLSIYI